MSKATNALKMMYNMERFATAIYKTQSRAFHEEEIINRLAAASQNEQQHVANLNSRIIKLGGSPSRFGLLFQVAGSIFGFIVSFLGRVFVLRTDVWIEERAIKDYRGYMRRLRLNKNTVALLQRIVEDEKRHVDTWRDSIKIIKKRTTS